MGNVFAEMELRNPLRMEFNPVKVKSLFSFFLAVGTFRR